jgi:hypothetical protein
MVHLNTYAVPAVPVKVLEGLLGAVIFPPDPPMIVQVPIPITGVFAERVATVKPHIEAPV